MAAAAATSAASATGSTSDPVMSTAERKLSNTTDTWDTYNFEWLFDPDRMDHLPIDEQLKLYKQRDLAKVKFFKTACKIFGAPASRKRVITAPPMNLSWQDRPKESKDEPKGLEDERAVAELKPYVPPPSMPSQEQLEEWKKWDKEAEYKKWVSERRSFRKNLENMGLSEEWLSAKTDKTALEHRVLNRMLEEKYPRKPTPPPPEDVYLDAVMSDESPTVKRPSPLAIRIIEEFLQKKKMRLLDLFAIVDKNKNWKVTRDEFRRAIKLAKIPISDVLLEDLILALDMDLNNELDYREMAKGMGLWKKEKISSKRKLIESRSMNHSPTKYSQLSGFETPGGADDEEDGEEVVQAEHSNKTPLKPNRSQSAGLDSQSAKDTTTTATTSSRVKSAVSNSSTGSGTRLEPPEPDLRPEQLILSSEEAMVDLRKHNKAALSRLTADRKEGSQEGSPEDSVKQDAEKPEKTSGHSSPLYSGTTSAHKAAGGGASDAPPAMIRSGDSAVDAHIHPTTLVGEMGGMVNQFRQDRLREYNEIGRLCEEHELPFTEDMIKRVFLYPGDKIKISRRIRQPALQLLSQNFTDADPARKARSWGAGGNGKNGNGRGNNGQGKGKGGRRLSPLRKGAGHRHGSSMSDDDDGPRECKHAYPGRSNLRPQAHKMRLSTGKAVIRTKVDCWMTFEEYERITSHLSAHHMLSESDPNAVWPGQLLGKLRIMLDKHKPADVLFRHVPNLPPVNKGYNNNLKTWNISDNGYVQYGTISK